MPLLQPKTLALIITLLPLLAINLAYLISASAGYVPWCITYVDGCTSISRASREGAALLLFRPTMIVQAVLVAWYWAIARAWLLQLGQHHSPCPPKATAVELMFFLGITGALFLILYADFLGTTGRVYRFMRRYGVIFYFTFTPLAQMLMLYQLKKCKTVLQQIPHAKNVIAYQLMLLLLILVVGITSLMLSYSGYASFERENVLEWNFALLMTLFFAGSAVMWQDLHLDVRVREPH